MHGTSAVYPCDGGHDFYAYLPSEGYYNSVEFSRGLKD